MRFLFYLMLCIMLTGCLTNTVNTKSTINTKSTTVLYSAPFADWSYDLADTLKLNKIETIRVSPGTTLDGETIFPPYIGSEQPRWLLVLKDERNGLVIDRCKSTNPHPDNITAEILNLSGGTPRTLLLGVNKCLPDQTMDDLSKRLIDKLL